MTGFVGNIEDLTLKNNYFREGCSRTNTPNLS